MTTEAKRRLIDFFGFGFGERWGSTASLMPQGELGEALLGKQ